MSYENLSVEEINAEIARLRKMSDDYKNEEQGVKLTLNSIYGALGNQYFACFNTEVAESVTLQGQDLIKFAEKIINKYFHEHWHLDTELHQKMNVTNVRPISAEMVIYVDTDSNYVNFGNVISSCEFDYNPLDFILKINDLRLADYIKNCLEIYAKKWNTNNYQDFELEAISRNAIFLGKKKYIVNLTYEAPGKHHVDLSRIKPTGIEIVQGGTPPFAREKLIFLLKHLFETGRKFDIRTFVKMLREIKSEFKIQKPEAISIGVGVNNIEKFILNDTTKFEVAKGCPMHVRAAGYHNYILNNSKYKAKYSLIRSSEKIKYYFVAVNSEQENNVFGYLNGSYPYEYAPPIDFDAQFNRTILDPINRFIEVMGYNPLSPNLLLVSALF
jgi:DNA polymerase elongation subunit (family B)